MKNKELVKMNLITDNNWELNQQNVIEILNQLDQQDSEWRYESSDSMDLGEGWIFKCVEQEGGEWLAYTSSDVEGVPARRFAGKIVPYARCTMFAVAVPPCVWEGVGTRPLLTAGDYPTIEQAVAVLKAGAPRSTPARAGARESGGWR